MNNHILHRNLLSIACDQKRFDHWKKLIEDYPFKHISAYFLSIEDGTPLQKKVEKGIIQNPNDIGPEEMFDVAEVLENHGFEHYEISNYSQKSYRCKHNISYWKSEDYIGFGPAAVSCIDHIRYTEESCLENWLNKSHLEKEVLSIKDQRNEYLMLHLRLLTEGLDLDKFEKLYGLQKEEFYINLNRYISSGEIIKEEQKIRLSPLGIVMANSIISDLFA